MSERHLDIIIQKLDEILAKNEELEKSNAIKDDELALLREQVAFLTQKLYGRKKELLDSDLNQGNLFVFCKFEVHSISNLQNTYVSTLP